MSFYQEVFNNYLDTFSLLYVQVGRIELTLRNVIPQIISGKFAEEKANWFTPLEFDVGIRRKIKNAKKYQKTGEEEIQKHLPLSFWTQLFTAKNYESLWIPYLHFCFPNLKNPKSKRSSKELEYLMRELNSLRNHIAHYNFSRFDQWPSDREKLAQLEFLLGIKVN